ncbi:MAG: hypothetical protein D6763_11515 [Alphaproteobacteria bacterium]|nr:MAG: hypothetical protein D6763_11515 [Alphaproteobacteria bacterium]
MRPLTQTSYDTEGVRRVARTLLRHIRPETRHEAFAILDGRIGVYAVDRTVIAAEIDYYFNESEPLAA